ncbi:HlyC/CorC family transporter [bacterium LRH843]|nr:HlyC/CorC family transporter [bacterium LRH843]
MDSIPSIMLLGALLLFSSYFSASETALTSASKLRLRNQSEQQSKKAKRSLQLIEKYDQTLSTVLIGNNIVNIAMASIATSIATQLYGTSGSTVFITAAIITVLILVFGEILPKSLAKQFAEKFLLHASASLMIILKLFYPFTWLVVKLKLLINKVLGSSAEEPTVTDDDVKALVEMGEEEGTFLSNKKELLHKAIEFDDIVVKNILTPRPDVIAVSTDTPIEVIKQIFIQEKYSRLPVYDGSIDNIIGVISHRDFFTHYVMNEKEFYLSTIIRKPYFVIGSAKISSLLGELQKGKVHLAIVLDEYGGTLGIVSMEDIIEELFGEIWDEHDENEILIEQIDQEKMLLNGRFPIEEFSELVKSDIPETSSITLSGWISDTLGYLPKKGDSLEYDTFRIYIEEVRNRRIQKVIVQMNQIQTA